MAIFREDGYTLMVGGNSSHAANVHTMKEPGYDPVKDFTPIIRLTMNPQILVISTDLPVRTLHCYFFLIALEKSKSATRTSRSLSS